MFQRIHALVLVALCTLLVFAGWVLSLPTQSESVAEQNAAVSVVSSTEQGQELGEVLVRSSAVAAAEQQPTVAKTHPEPAEELVTAATLKVRVLARGSNTPLQGTELKLSLFDAPTQKALLEVEGVTDADGNLYARIPNGSLRIFVEIKMKGVEQRHRAWREITVPTGELLEWVVAIPPLYHITLVFVGPEKAPVVGKPVQISSTEDRNGAWVHEDAVGPSRTTSQPVSFHQSFVTDDSGSITVPFVSGELRANLFWTAKGFAPVQYRAVLGEEDDGATVVVPLFPLREVHVLVQDGGALPIGEVILNASYQATPLLVGEFSPGSPPARQPIRTDEDGKAVMALAMAPFGSIQTQHRDYVEASVELSAAQTEVTITLGTGTGFSGRVIDELNAPVAHAEVRAWAYSHALPSGHVMARGPSHPSGWQVTTTDAEGNFKLPELSGVGFSSLMVLADGFAFYGQNWPSPPSGFHEIVLHPAAQLFGFLHDAEGNGIARASIILQGPPAFGGNSRKESLSYFAGAQQVKTASDGSFAFPGLAAGEYELYTGTKMAETVARVHTGPNPVILTQGELADGVVVVAIQVLGAPSFQPIEGIEITLVSFVQGAIRRESSGRTDTQGKFRSPPMLKHKGHFMIYERGYLPKAIWLESLPSGLSEHQVVLEPGLPKTLHIIAVDHLPLRPGSFEAAPGLRAGLVLEAGSFMPIGGEQLSSEPRPLSVYGIEGFEERQFRFESFPINGATLRLQEGNGGASFDFSIPGGAEDYTLTLSAAQLRILGLRD